MSQPLFGTGLLALTANLASGQATPIQVAVLKDVSLDVSFKVVDLVGNLQFPVDKAKAEGKMSGKFTTGYFAGGLINAILSGSSVAVGSSQAVFAESFTLAAGTYTTAKGALTIAGSAGDLGVFNVTQNKFMTAVASGPATGQYVPATSGGVMTFAAADNGNTIQVSYLYTASAVGTTISLTNQMMGINTTFSLKLFNQYASANPGAQSGAGNAGILLPVVTIPKLSFPFKNNNFLEKQGEFEVSANSAGQVAYFYTGN